METEETNGVPLSGVIEVERNQEVEALDKEEDMNKQIVIKMKDLMEKREGMDRKE